MLVTLRGHESDPRAAWALLGDTDTLNRIADNPRLEVRLEPDRYGFPEVVGRMHGPGPITHTYREVDSRWVQGEWFEQERAIEGPLLRRTHLRARLEEGAAGGVIPVIELEVGFSNALTNAVGGAITRSNVQRWQQALDALPAPGAVADRAAIRQLPRQVDDALERWRRRGVDEGLVARFADWMRAIRAPDLRSIRPFELAEQWGLERRELVRAFLEGTQAGAVELYWVVRCPRCGGGLSQADSLSDLADHVDCPSCRIGTDTELDRNVEVLFAAHPAVRPPPGEAFCTMYPTARPELAVLATVAGEARETVEVDLPPGRWALGAGGEEADVILEVGDHGTDEVRWEEGTGSRHRKVQAGRVQVELVNPTPGRHRVQLSGDPDGGRWLSAAWLSTMPEYRRSFGAQALAPDVRLGVRAVAILFTDLTGSAALYHEHGDALAFQLVHQQFGVLEAVVEEYGGARVKTIGDALMVAFVDPSAAVGAAIAMQEHFQAWAAGLDMEQPPGLKVGLHFGPAMAAHTDQAGLDYFGGTVNLAARCEGQSGRGLVVWTRAVQEAPGVAERLARWGGPVEPFEAEVKGIPGVQTLYRARVGEGQQTGAS